jgi:transcriptional regulator with PAS, ATPase and Fis domain
MYFCSKSTHFMNLPLPENMVPDWAKELPLSITVTDNEANIIYMNDKAVSTFSKYGGETLIGKSLFDCHNPVSADTIRQLLETGDTNVYTIEKQGQKKLIWQSAWFIDDKISGLVEISIVLTADMPHHKRD